MSPTPWWGADELEDAAGANRLWDTFFLGDFSLPGKAEVKVGSGAGRKLDTRAAAGSDGWSLVDRGASPVKFTVTLTLWTQDQYDRWSEASRIITSQLGLGRQRGANDVARNPVLADLNVTHAYIEEVGGLDLKGDGSATVELKFVQFKPPSRRAATHRVQPHVPPHYDPHAPDTNPALTQQPPAATRTPAQRGAGNPT